VCGGTVLSHDIGGQGALEVDGPQLQVSPQVGCVELCSRDWDIISFGAPPWMHMKNIDAALQIHCGNRMARPAELPKNSVCSGAAVLYHDSEAQPSFPEPLS